MEQGTRNKEDSERLIARLAGEMPAAAREALKRVEALCRERGVALYLVGGAVRDLLLGRSQVDLDLAVEAEVAPIAQALAKATVGKATLHERFGTAHVTGPGYALDLARTRRETYDQPGALPTVEPVTSVLDDLARRDFTINAMALRLTDPVELIDPFGGAADLGAGLVRVLHERSFQDDATRMLRAVRYAARLGFDIEAQTETWLQRDLAYVDAISGPRLRRELTLIFDEPTGPDATLLAQRLGVLGRVHEKLRVVPAIVQMWREALAGKPYAPFDELGFCLVVDPREAGDVEAVAARLHLTARVEKALRDLVRLRELSDKLAASLGSPLRRSSGRAPRRGAGQRDSGRAAAVELLDGRAKAAVWAVSLLDRGPAGEAGRLYLDEWQQVKPSLRGDDLLTLGVPPGEAVGAMLRRLRAARLAGEISSRDEEVALVRRELAGGAKG
jgi:tRNA nucleotidyltransferase (CCA-adding enzyme)